MTMASLTFGSASRLATPALAALVLGCLGPNPLLEAGEDASDTTLETGDGDGDAEGDGDGDGDGESEGDGDGDGDGDELLSCSNDALDGDETDVDCGGSCGPCEPGASCLAETDCASQVCADASCQAATCDDDVQNSDEVGVDCGGAACGFCQHSPFLAELDDFEGSDATRPQVAMFADHSFVVTYNGPLGAHARWFDELGASTGPNVELGATVDFKGDQVIPVFAGVGESHPIHALIAGTGPSSTSTDVFLIRRTQSAEDPIIRINASNVVANLAGVTVDGSVATLTWQANNTLYTRRLDYDIDGSWTDISPFQPETEPDTYKGTMPAMARNAAGVIVVAWVRCEIENSGNCKAAVRRFDSGWIDPEPVLGDSPGPGPVNDPRVAIAEDGRVATIWTITDLDVTGIGAWILDADLNPESQPWALQNQIPLWNNGGVAALDDGSFAFIWPDRGQHRVHLRRYVSAETPKLPDIGDESPWPITTTPTDASIANVDGRLVAVWSATVDNVKQIQGQVLSY